MTIRNFRILLIITLAVLTAVLSAGCTASDTQQDSKETIINNSDNLPVSDDKGEYHIHTTKSSDPTLDEKIGQMLMIGFRGYTADNDSQIADDIRKGRTGGVILFDHDVALGTDERNIRSPEQVRTLNNQLQGYAEDIPLFIAVDQEGGKICRLKEKYGFPATVSAEYLGTENNETLTRNAGSNLAGMLKENGFNMNFAPVVDLNVNPDSPAIGKLNRSYSADPDVVTDNAGWIIEEHKNLGIITAIKHFPGHGSAMADSHEGFTDVTGTWSEEELIPYQNLIKEDLPDMIMTAHIYNKNLDPDYPATLSEKTVTGILRDKLAYEGVIITDAMDMGAITDSYGLRDALKLSINAGCDIFLFANNIVYDENIAEKSVSIVKELVKEGEIPEERINESYERIITLKKKYLPGNYTKV
ncbi:glycoside hydrolase family 3 protein [Methanoplanus limicola]|uniref:beta-N-acetylhexosaminidase n=1 Tax=Methanoplanus limicola DSM 2279 TaxID=937775 RepID=H1YZH0_9EURY|nr:glycoside hydrolase family 3 protein [Methanoplanus limicola]EHQ36079.1 glycoside hydrolase family 3 domain protein [Methanoplanus limicola DSM 2279]